MKCPYCGKELPAGAASCPACGAPAGPVATAVAEAPPPDLSDALKAPPLAPAGGEAWRAKATAEENASVGGQKVSPNVYLGADGKLRWVYELNLSKNPTARRLVQKIVRMIYMGCMAVFTAFAAFYDLSGAKYMLLVWGGIGVLFELVTLLSMAIVSAVYKKSYCTIYEMDDEKITQIQMKRTFERSQVLGFVLLLMSDDMADAITSIRLATQDRYDTRFRKVRKIRITRKWNYIYLGGWLTMCPLYVSPEDWDFVLSYVLDHVPAKTAEKFWKKYGERSGA